MSNTKKVVIIAIVILITLAAIGCDMNESAETIKDASETVAEIGTVHSMLKGLADQDYAQPSTSR